MFAFKHSSLREKYRSGSDGTNRSNLCGRSTGFRRELEVGLQIQILNIAGLQIRHSRGIFNPSIDKRK